MKLQGTRPGAPKPRFAVFERDGNEFVFTINAVLNYKDFEALCPEPQPRRNTVPGGASVVMLDEPKFLKLLEKHGELKTHWTILKAIEATEGLEWERIVMTDPDTWHLYKDELSEAGFTEGEIAYLINEIYKSLGVDEARMKEAHERFTRSQVAAER